MVNQIIDFISEYEGIERSNILEDSCLVHDLGLSSVDLFDLMSALESVYNIPELTSKDITHINSVGDIAKYIEANT